jgi:two-component system sensor histidine kinase and response regulator WspE
MATGGNLGGFSMFDLFRIEAESQLASLNEGLLELEKNVDSPSVLEALMRASHSLKGAAKMIGIDAIVKISHVMEDCFVAAQKGLVRLDSHHIDTILKAVDQIEFISKLPEEEIEGWYASNAPHVDAIVGQLSELLLCMDAPQDVEMEESLLVDAVVETPDVPAGDDMRGSDQNDVRTLRVGAEQMSTILGMASELMVENRWLQTLSNSLRRVKRRQDEIAIELDHLRAKVENRNVEDDIQQVKHLQQQVEKGRRHLNDHLASLDDYERRSTYLSNKLYNEINNSRMRPFATGTAGFSRMVRDLARELSKEVDFNIIGADTPVDRDVLEKLKAPLTHLLRNAVDHGIEKPEQRAAAGKSLRANLTLEASHGAGLLHVCVRDDGGGVDLHKLREKVVRRGYINEGLQHDLNEEELIEFLFLPDFSTRDSVTDISGRGVGLDVVRDMVRALGGTVAVNNREGQGVKFTLQLPLSLSVMSAVIVELCGEAYAFPVTRTDRLVAVEKTRLKEINGRRYFELDGQNVGLISGAQLLELEGPATDREELDVVVVSDRLGKYGVVVDRIIGQRQLSVQALDERLGKIKDISSAALLEDGSPALIFDVDDVVRSIDHIVSGESIADIRSEVEKQPHSKFKRVLVVEDSLTVREVERELLQSRGYKVATAVDGVDGWNAVRESDYDLVITDIDMPRMDGIALVKAIKQDLHLKSIPVMIVSYKDRREDRQRGLEAGADYYLTKGSFHDDSLLEAVADLIGEARE